MAYRMERSRFPLHPQRLFTAVKLWPAGVGLALNIWLLLDALQHPPDRAVGSITRVSQFLFAGLALTLLALRGRYPTTCFLSVYLMALGILSQDNVLGFTLLGPPNTAHLPPEMVSYRAPQVVWCLALGMAPLGFAWIYTEEEQVTTPRPIGRWLTITFLFCATLGQLACMAMVRSTLHTGLLLDQFARKSPSAYHALLIYALPMLAAQQGVTLWLLIQHYRRFGELRNRALARCYALALVFIVSVVANDAIAVPATFFFSQLMALIVPLSLVTAFERYALLDIQITVRRTVQYALARHTLVALTATPLLLLSFFLGLHYNPAPHLPPPLDLIQTLSLSRAALLSALLTALFGAMLAIRKPLVRWFDRNYFREAYDAQRVLNEASRSIMSLSDPRDIARAALEAIDVVFHPTNAMFFAEENGSVKCLARRNYSGYVPPLWPDPSLLDAERILELPPHDVPSARHAESSSRWIESLPKAALDVIRRGAIRLVVPLRDGEKTTGVLLLGTRTSGLNFTVDDIEVLRALANGIGLAVQSARINQEFLRQRTRELTSRSVSFVEVVEKERRLLAADLHDQTLPELRGLLRDLQGLSERDRGPDSPEAPPVHVVAAEMADQVRQTMGNIRDIMESLRPSALEMLGLLPAMESELRKATGRVRPPIVPHFEVLDGTEPEGMTTFAQLSLFRIMQEAVNNACRHSQARTIRVQIGVEEHDWFLRVDDNGIGLPPESMRRQGRGLDNMQYRASLIGARITWRVPEWGHGAGVELRMPWNAAAREE